MRKLSLKSSLIAFGIMTAFFLLPTIGMVAVEFLK